MIVIQTIIMGLLVGFSVSLVWLWSMTTLEYFGMVD
jgi:hypothetical protein